MYSAFDSDCDGNKGVGFHPLVRKVLISGSYLVCLCVRACPGNLSWQYVNSMSWIVYVGDGVRGVCVWFGAHKR